MRRQTLEFLAKFIKEKKPKGTLLDVGSRNINGIITEMVKNAGLEYEGLDMIKGDNVSLVLNAHDIKKKLKEGQFDVVCCFDTLEHDNKFWITVENIRWVLKKGGWLLIGVPSRYCPKHDHPHDYWRFMEDGVKLMFAGMTDIYIKIDYNKDTEDEIYGWGRKK